jgi:hypothetical protein
MLIPIVTRQTEQFLREVPLAARGALALGASKWKTIATVVVPAGSKGILTGMILGVARIAGESAPLLFTAFNNQFWGGGITQPTASLPVMIYSRDRPLRRLASPGLGGGPGSDRHGPDRQHRWPVWCWQEVFPFHVASTLKSMSTAPESASQPHQSRVKKWPLAANAGATAAVPSCGPPTSISFTARSQALYDISSGHARQPDYGADRPFGLRQVHVPAESEPHQRHDSQFARMEGQNPAG